MEDDSSYSYGMHAQVMYGPCVQCHLVSGESRETKDWPPATFW